MVASHCVQLCRACLPIANVDRCSVMAGHLLILTGCFLLCLPDLLIQGGLIFGDAAGSSSGTSSSPKGSSSTVAITLAAHMVSCSSGRSEISVGSISAMAALGRMVRERNPLTLTWVALALLASLCSREHGSLRSQLEALQSHPHFLKDPLQ